MTTHRSRLHHRPVLLGLVLVAAFLGHDLLMAAGAPSASSGHRDTHHAAPASSAPHDDTAPEHPAKCRVIRSAAPRTVDHPDAAVGLAPSLLFIDGLALPTRSPSPPWDAPAPSSVLRRVLLQVFRL